MQAVLLAAGQSSRFYPFNREHKSLQILFGKPIITHTLESVKRAGIEDVIIVCQDKSLFEKHLGNGEQLGISITYCIQNEARGMGDALLSAEQYISSDFFLLSAHRADFEMYHEKMIQKKNDGADIVLVAKQENDLSQFGYVTLDGDRVTQIFEKPEEGITNGYRLLSTYLLNASFLHVLREAPSEHYQLETALNTFCSNNAVRSIVIDDDAYSLKYPWDLLEMKNYMLGTIKPYVSPHVEISDTAQITGDVVIEDGVRILEYAVIKGPCYIGKNALIGDFAVVRGGSVIEESAQVGVYTEVKNSIVGKGTHIHSGYIGDSILGEDCRIGAGFCTSNVRLDRNEVEVKIQEKIVNSRRESLGVILGNNVKVGTRVSTMPGIVVGNNAVVGPSTTVMNNVEDSTTLYTQFETVIKK